MTGNIRRSNILQKLSNTDQAIPAREFASQYDVSRQIIVGDIALLRAEGHPIIASNRGYLIKEKSDGWIKKYLAMNHKKEETQLELEIFVEYGVFVESVTVEHPIYGEITGYLNIKTKEDIKLFLKQEAELLSTLTEGIHIHTVLCENIEDYNAVKERLEKENLLYQNN